MGDKNLRSPQLFLDGQKSLKVSKALQKKSAIDLKKKKNPKTHTHKKNGASFTLSISYTFLYSTQSLSLLPTENPHGGESELHEDDEGGGETKGLRNGRKPS